MDVDKLSDYVLIWSVLGLLAHFLYSIISG